MPTRSIVLHLHVIKKSLRIFPSAWPKGMNSVPQFNVGFSHLLFLQTRNHASPHVGTIPGPCSQLVCRSNQQMKTEQDQRWKLKLLLAKKEIKTHINRTFWVYCTNVVAIYTQSFLPQHTSDKTGTNIKHIVSKLCPTLLSAHSKHPFLAQAHYMLCESHHTSFPSSKAKYLLTHNHVAEPNAGGKEHSRTCCASLSLPRGSIPGRKALWDQYLECPSFWVAVSDSLC